MQIGTDIIQVNRLENSLEKFGDKFKEKFLTQIEIENTKKIESIAGLWASKEAISKALGCGISKELRFQDIIISKNNRGQPSFELSERARKNFHIKSSSLSISHDGGFAIAVVALSLE